MKFTPLLLALALPALALSTPLAQDAPETVEEPGSRVEFPVRLTGAALAEGLASSEGKPLELTVRRD